MQRDLWLAFVGASIAISVSPGAGAIQSMSTGLTHGLRRGAWSVAGLQIGLMTQLAVVAVGLGAAVALDDDALDLLVQLSAGEFGLLRAFVERPERVLSRDQLLEIAFAVDTDAFDRAVDVQVSRLRRKLERPNAPELIRTVRGEGYLLAVRPKRG